MHIRWDIHTLAYATLHIGNLLLTQLSCLGVHLHYLLIECRNEHGAIVKFQQRWDKSEVYIECLFSFRLISTWSEGHNVGGTG